MPRFGFGSGAHRPVRVPPGVAAPLTAIAGDGWEASVDSPADLSLAPVTVMRPGFTGSGAATSHAETLQLTKRVRQPYPATTGSTVPYTAHQVALSDYVYAGDVLANVVNNSTETSPKPVGAWVMPSRLLVGGSVHWEMVAFHRNARFGRQIACAEVRAQALDAGGNPTGSPTAWQTVALPTLSTMCEDRNAVEVFAGDLDVSGLPDGLFRLEGRQKPWIGTAASILSTDDSSALQEFSPRYFLKDTARAAARPLAYISPTGSDTTGAWSANAASAKAAPFATWIGAFNAIYAAGSATLTGGKADGCEFRFTAGTHTLTGPAAALKRRLDAAAIVLTRDPDSPRASCIVTFGTWSSNAGIKADGSGPSLLTPLSETAVIFRDLYLQRTGNAVFGSTSSGGIAANAYYQYRNVTLDNGGSTIALLSGTTTVADAAYGLEVFNAAGATLSGGAQRRMWRGLRMDAGEGTASPAGLSAWRVIGCEITRPTSFAVQAAQNDRGLIAYANRFLKQRLPVVNVNASTSTATIGDVVVAQNLFEFVGALTSGVVQPAFAVGQGFGHTLNVIVHHNTVTGYGAEGKFNMAYAGFVSPFTNQNHRLWSVKGNLFAQLNQKDDWWGGNQNQPNAATFIGSMAVEHGVGMTGNFDQFFANTGFPESILYAGIGSVRNTTSATVRQDPLFENYQGTTGSAGTAAIGAGGGDYHLQAGSPARGIMAGRLFGYTLDGAARGTTVQPAGVYA